MKHLIVFLSAILILAIGLQGILFMFANEIVLSAICFLVYGVGLIHWSNYIWGDES